MSRNSVVEETVAGLILTECLERLREAVPSTWSVALESEPTASLSDLVRADATLTISSAEGSPVTMAVEVRQASRGAVAASVSRTSMISELTGSPAVIMTDYANPALRTACLDAGLGFLDTTGWIRLNSDRPALFVSAQGASRPPGNPRTVAITRLNGPSTGRVIRTLFDADLPIGVRNLASEAGVSPGSVAKLLPTLVASGALERDPKGAVATVHPRALLKRWTQDYSFTTANREVSWFLSPRGVDGLLDRIPAGCAVAVTGSLAARRMLPVDVTPVTPLVLAALYTARPTTLAQELGLYPAAPGTANVVLARPSEPSLLQPGERRSGKPAVVPLAQLLADLLTLPGRSPEEAEQVMDILARSRARWAVESEPR